MSASADGKSLITETPASYNLIGVQLGEDVVMTSIDKLQQDDTHRQHDHSDQVSQEEEEQSSRETKLPRPRTCIRRGGVGTIKKSRPSDD